ncbi:acyltransferase family protein [Janthinobacterium sp. HLX7-2]|uniref:acyltransferase family protein n=1 Tax=Janthinobacterium sp. HLX7-2 TaxID=1259331 RepID=UPI003F27DF9D
MVLPVPYASRLPGLDLLRALAIVWIMLYHLESYGVRLPGPIVAYGWMGVDLFFVLSGYLIGWQLLRPWAAGAPSAWWPWWRQFMLRRSLRILPAYLAVLALYVLLPASGEAAVMRPLWQFLTFSVNLFPASMDARAFSHAWSLCVEEHFYLLLPPVAWWLARRPAAGKTVAVALGILLAGMLLRAWLWRQELAPLAGQGAYVERFIALVYMPSPTRLDGLLMGVMLAVTRGFRPAWWTWLMVRGPMLLGLGAVGLAAAMWLLRGVPGYAAIVFGYPLLSCSLACLVAGCISERTWPGRWRLPGAATLATLAFSLYLTHKQVYHALDAYLGDWLGTSAVLAFCAYNGAALLAAAALYWLVERPALRLRTRWLVPVPVHGLQQLA